MCFRKFELRFLPSVYWSSICLCFVYKFLSLNLHHRLLCNIIKTSDKSIMGRYKMSQEQYFIAKIAPTTMMMILHNIPYLYDIYCDRVLDLCSLTHTHTPTHTRKWFVSFAAKQFYSSFITMVTRHRWNKVNYLFRATLRCWWIPSSKTTKYFTVKNFRKRSSKQSQNI